MKAVLALIGLLTAPSLLSAGEDSIDYLRDIKPILRSRCYACHGALKQEMGLRLDSAALMLKGGESGPAVIAGDQQGSLILQRISTNDESVRMPPEGKPLTPDEVAKLTRWVQQGSPAPADERPEENPHQHWAFRPVTRPTLPAIVAVPGAEVTATNPIDAFIIQARDAAGVSPLPPTDRSTLLRRVYLDLIGIPPSADELQAFLEDASPTSFDTVVDRLLDSPQYGERWGRHWMDVWRYSDWYGRRSVPDVMNSYPMIWRWRDWIVRSLNDDKPYDQMVREMLAADELMPGDEHNLVATGYLVRSWFKWNYETWKKDLVEHTGKAFLGLTLNCAQCHDHKYDPIAQEEYFRFRAFFEPLELRHDRVAGEPDPGPFVKYVYGQPYGPIKSGMVRVFDENLSAETFMFAKGDSRLRMEGKPPVRPAAPEIVGGQNLTVSSLTLPIESAYPGMKSFVRAEERAKRQSALARADAELAKAREVINAQPVELRDELAQAEEALAEARATVNRRLATATPPHVGTSPARALHGSQALAVDAKTGRRALAHPLPGIEMLADDGIVSYLLQIVQDGHTNLQLALDLAQGATGGFIAFEKGSIKTYVPGGFQEVIAGTYDLAKGQDRFEVRLRLRLAQNQFLLSVRSLSDDRELIKEFPAALNGWKPQADGKRGLFLDCRPGTEAIYDDLCFAQSDGTPLTRFDFEAPDYQEGQEIPDLLATTGAAAWLATSFCQPPASSKITSAVSSDPSVQAASTRLAAARQALRPPWLNLTAAEARQQAAKLELECLEKRIEADTVRYSTGLLSEDRKSEPPVSQLIAAAVQSERHALLASAQAELASADAAVAAAEEQVLQATKRSDQTALNGANTALQTAQKQRTSATAAVNSANANQSKEIVDYSPLSPKYPQVTTGRRAALAQWMTRRDNPLTARVAVNHMWLRHFGKALVETTHDFGRNGSRPSHPELLDWLACELMDSGWSMKHVHRLIVTSDVYRLTSMAPQTLHVDEQRLAVSRSRDPDNRTYWRFPESRMQAEVVRDSLLAVAGELDGTLGGNEIDHKQGLTSRRRSLYFAHHGEEKMEFLELFDAANPCDCYKRTTSVQPQQALALTNSELTKTLSRQLAQRLWTRVTAEVDAVSSSAATAAAQGAPQTPTIDAGNRFVELAFLQVLNRRPRPQELTASRTFLEQQSRRLQPAGGATAAADPELRSRENLVHALMNHNDFVTVR